MPDMTQNRLAAIAFRWSIVAVFAALPTHSHTRRMPNHTMVAEVRSLAEAVGSSVSPLAVESPRETVPLRLV